MTVFLLAVFGFLRYFGAAELIFSVGCSNLMSNGCEKVCRKIYACINGEAT